MLKEYIAIMNRYQELHDSITEKHTVLVTNETKSALRYTINNMQIDINTFSRGMQPSQFFSDVHDTVNRVEEMAKDHSYFVYMGVAAELKKYLKDHCKKEA
jgi:hypothetical protein